MHIKNKIEKQIKKYTARYFALKQRKLELRAKGDTHKYVLMFHQIVDDMRDSYNPEFTISTEKFVKLIHQLEKESTFISIDDVLDQTVERGVFLTFDDAFEGVYTKAFPILKEKNIDFAVFQTIGKLNKKMWLTAEQLKELDEYKGCTIGAHTISHPHLRHLSAKESRTEVLDGGIQLTKILGHKIISMAYPYGACSDIGIREKRYSKHGYSFAFSTLQCCVPKKVDRYFIPRVNVCEENFDEIIRMINE